MENRARERPEIQEEEEQLPANKRACSEAGPSTSFPPDPREMESSSSASPSASPRPSASPSVSGRSEVDADRDSPDWSCDSDGMDEDAHYQTSSFRDVQRRISGENHSKFKRILSNLDAGAGPSEHLAALTDLCDTLSLSTEDMLSGFPFDSFVPCLVSLANQDGNPDIMLLAFRAIAYLCDRSRRTPDHLVRCDAVPVLCGKLMVIEYLDVAEQVCLGNSRYCCC